MSGADVVELARRLIACPSITPARGQVFDVVEQALAPLGFEILRTLDGLDQEGGGVENLIALRPGPAGTRHFAFAGHLDVVPPGAGWTGDPFAPQVRDGFLVGRGAVDMKGALAAFIAALADVPAELGTVSLLVTGDEEGPGLFGTRAIMVHMAERGIEPDLILVGEPTSHAELGDTIKIGRRGSVNMWIAVEGAQGHVAYPHLAHNPIPQLIEICHAIDQLVLDNGSQWFPPSTIEFTNLEVGNPATNVIPARAEARLAIRFNDHHSGESLTRRIGEIVSAGGGTLRSVVSGEPFLTPPGRFSELIGRAVEAETGRSPEASTSGGTSDARFLSRLAPTVELGLVNATMHKLNEAVALDDLRCLTRIYARIVREALRARLSPVDGAGAR